MSASLVRAVTVAALAIAAVAVLVVLLRGGNGGHQVSAVVPGTSNIVAGQPVFGAGKKIGVVKDVAPVDRGRAARITIGIDASDHWPLPRDTKVEIRQGGTASFSNQYLQLTRGKDAGQTIPDGGELASRNVKVPVDLQDVLDLFDTTLRRDIKRVLDSSAAAVDRMGPQLQRTLRRSTPLVRAASDTLADLTANEGELRELVRSTGSVVDAVDRANPDLRTLLDGAAGTLDAVAAEADDLELTLARLPGALRQTRSTLANADVTLRDVRDLADDVEPGVEELRRTARPLRETLRALSDVTPGVVAALNESRGARSFGDVFFGFSKNAAPLKAIGEHGTKEVGCLRPYTPELMALGTSWGDFISGVDGKDHYLRAQVQNWLPAPYNSSLSKPADLARLFPGLEYGFPRPPGALAGQPWFQPQCGVGEDAVDPAKDQETIRGSRRKGAGR